MIKVSIIIVSYNTKNVTKNCLESIYDHFDKDIFELIVVDNASIDGSRKFLEKFKKTNLKVVFGSKNLGFGGANNLGRKHAKGKYLLFLNSDTKVKDNFLKETVLWYKDHPETGVMSCALVNADGSMQGTGGYFPTLPRVFSWMTIQDLPYVDLFIKPFHPMKERSPIKGVGFYRSAKELDWVTGAFMMIPASLYDEVGGFDTNFFMYTEDVDLCYRIRKLGYKVYYKPEWSVIHLGGVSGKEGDSIIREFEGVKIFYHKHYPKWQYQVLRVLLRTGASLRMVFYKIFGEGKAYNTYRRALNEI